jgi:lysophospholipase L1-like esterase
MEYVLIVLVILFPIACLYIYGYGKKQGMNFLLSLLIKSGFEAKVQGYKKQNQFIQKGGIVFVGDSITQDYNVYEYFSEYTVYNRGIGGDTTEGLLKRMHESIFDLNPSHVIILMGTNDFGVLNSNPQDIFERMKKIVSLIQMKLPDTKIILLSVYPVNPTLDHMSVGQRNNRNIQALNQLYQTIEGINYLDIYNLLIDNQGNLNKDYTVEGLHINQNGYQIITEHIKNHLN